VTPTFEPQLEVFALTLGHDGLSGSRPTLFMRFCLMWQVVMCDVILFFGSYPMSHGPVSGVLESIFP